MPMEVILERRWSEIAKAENLLKVFRMILMGILIFSVYFTMSPVNIPKEKQWSRGDSVVGKRIPERIAPDHEDVISENASEIESVTPVVENMASIVPLENVPSESILPENVSPERRQNGMTGEVPTSNIAKADTPADHVPVSDVPVDDAPVEDAPAGDMPMDDVPTEEIPVVSTVIDGFMVDENGCITGYQESTVVKSGLLALPDNAQCYAVGSHAFAGLEEVCIEIYIPANITWIDPDAFAELSHVFYIEVAPDNPAYYSDLGVLYSSDGQLVCYPGGR